MNGRWSRLVIFQKKAKCHPSQLFFRQVQASGHYPGVIITAGEEQINVACLILQHPPGLIPGRGGQGLCIPGYSRYTARDDLVWSAATWYGARIGTFRPMLERCGCGRDDVGEEAAN